MKYFFILALLTQMCFSADKLSDDEILKYFKHIALKQEFNEEGEKVRKKIIKWTKNINVYCDGKWHDELNKALKVIIKDLSSLTGNIKINIVNSRKNANYIIFIGSPEDYVKNIEPAAEEKVDTNFGLFWIYWNQNYEITRGSMYIDPQRAETLKWQKHLLREELTQSLGLMNDSLDYQDSIFYENYSQTTSYAKMDKILIKLLYSRFIRPGMSKRDVTRIIELQSLISKVKKEIEK